MGGKSVSVESRLALLSCLALVWLFHLIHSSSATDTLNPGDILKDWDSLDSPNKVFKFGFFNPLRSSNRYLAILLSSSMDSSLNSGYKMVWVANRENPLNDSSGYLNFTRDGFLVINDKKGASLIINSGEASMYPNKTLVLLNSGNLVLKAGEQVVWQSFDHPTDTFLPGMKIGFFDLKNKSHPRNRFLTSWLGSGVPSAGAFTLGVNPNNPKQLEVRRRGIPYWRSPTWNVNPNNTKHRQVLSSQNFKMINFSYTSNENESYFSYSVIDYKYSWIEINSTGNVRIFYQNTNSSGLGLAVICNNEQKEYYSKGCIAQKASKCSAGDEFIGAFGSIIDGYDLQNVSTSLSDCEQECRNDCSCMAYASYSPDGTGCKIFNAYRLDLRSLNSSEHIYVRNATETEGKKGPDQSHTPPDAKVTLTPPLVLQGTPMKKNRQQHIIIVGVFTSLGIFGLAFSLCYILRTYCFSKGTLGSSENRVGRDTQKYLAELGTSIAAMDGSGPHNLMLGNSDHHDLPMCGFSTIETATHYFSEENKLGRGGFGPVFKGKLVDGQEIAVKRLSERSSQGTEEFKNEIVLISKVQHRNLVRLYGCCIKGEEKLLVYEYLPNKSLDTFLFDETKRLLLDWKLRMKIIGGISQGLLYLHQFSRLKIIHRDLKTSNILLDNNMNPKISDFGTAKIFGENESRANTNRIVGTHGYMSPEYAMDGLFSVKSDVFSFGVMMLEIISGRRNFGFYQSNQSLNLTQLAWNLWKEQRSIELMDPILAETYCSAFEFERYVQIALLCVQETAEDRPNMSDVVSMIIGSDACIVPEPRRTVNHSDQPHSLSSSSVNGVTISTTYAR